MTTATVTGIETVRSHTVSDEWHNGKRLASSEELFPRVSATWRGRPVTVELHARRYVASNGWTPWNVYPGNVIYTDTEQREHATDTARQRLRAETVALVTAWLDSDAYLESRKRAYAWMLLHRLREDAGSVYGSPIVAELLERYRDEITPEIAERIERGLTAIETLHEVLQPSDGRDDLR
jgi:hypothetical protein